MQRSQEQREITGAKIMENTEIIKMLVRSMLAKMREDGIGAEVTFCVDISGEIKSFTISITYRDYSE